MIAVAIIELDGKIFIAQRAKNDRLLGKWEFPGGKVEAGETVQECLKRELFEELGIEAEIGEHFCNATVHETDDMTVFKVHSFKGAIVLNDHSDAQWVTRDELSNYAMPSPNQKIIELLQKV